MAKLRAKMVLKNRKIRWFIWVGLILLFLIAAWYSLFLLDFSSPNPPSFGVSFAAAQAEYLGLDPKETYLAILDDLKVRNIRISVYWNRIEPKSKKEDDFTELDWQVQEAEKHGAKLILAIGQRVPRWPECHTPEWASKLPDQQLQEALLSYLQKIVLRYRSSPALKIWQVENEPFLDLFGNCPKHNKKLLLQEISLVRSLDGRHPIMVTDSGEFGSWLRTKTLSDYLGTSIYRVVAQSWFGYIKYGGFIPPAYYHLKARLVGKPIDRVIVSELQAEPWTRKELIKTPISEQYRSMNLVQLRKNVEFAKRTGFGEIYLWGAEWWYWMKKQGEPGFWEEAKRLFEG